MPHSNIVQLGDNKWYFYDESGLETGPYETEELADKALNHHAKLMALEWTFERTLIHEWMWDTLTKNGWNLGDIEGEMVTIFTSLLFTNETVEAMMTIVAKNYAERKASL